MKHTEMASEMELYYFPASYFSQKAYLALYEKNVPFKKRYVYIHFGEQNQEWYLRLNPHGQVPTLKNGSDVIAGSEEIIDYVDRQSADGVRLVPDIATPTGRRVAEVRKWLYEIPIEAVTYGVFLHPALQPEGQMEIMKMMGKRLDLQTYEKNTRAALEGFKQRQKDCPSLHGAMAEKIKAYQWKLDNLLEETRVRGILGDLQKTFDQIEREIERSRTEAGRDDVWMCGTTFTAVDVVMAVLFNRLSLVELTGQYYSATKRPLVFAYYERLFSRPAVKRLVQESSVPELKRLFRRKMMKVAATKAVKVAVVVGIVAAVAYGVRVYIRNS